MEPWDDPLHDAVALVEAVRQEDAAGFRALMANLDPPGVVIVLGKLLSEVLDEQGIEPAWFRHWSADAITRP